MNAIVIICGGNASGKTATIESFFQGKFTIIDKGCHFFERMLDGMRVYAVSSRSPHEKVNDFCNIAEVNEEIKKRVDECDKKANGQGYTLIIPFTMSVSEVDRTKLNEDCILEPIKELQKRFKVFVIYLRKTNARNLAKKDALMEQVKLKTIETTKDDCDKSVELERYLREVVIKSH